MPKAWRSSEQTRASNSSLHHPVKLQAIVALVVAVLCVQALTTLCEAESNFKILHLWETHPPPVSTAWAELAQTALRGSAFFAAITGDGRPFVSGLDAAKILPELPVGQYAQVEVGRNFICGLTEDGEVVCTGEFASISRTPAGKFVQIATGPQYACALTNKGLATCWGRAFDRSDRMGTVTKAFADLNLVAIRPSWEDAPFENACGITRDGRLVCSDDANPAVSNFTTSLPASFRAQQLCMGVGFLCAIASPSQDLVCWLQGNSQVLRQTGPFSNIHCYRGNPRQANRITVCAYSVSQATKCLWTDQDQIVVTQIPENMMAIAITSIDESESPDGPQLFAIAISSEGSIASIKMNRNDVEIVGLTRDRMYTRVAAGAMGLCAVNDGGVVECKGGIPAPNPRVTFDNIRLYPRVVFSDKTGTSAVIGCGVLGDRDGVFCWTEPNDSPLNAYKNGALGEAAVDFTVMRPPIKQFPIPAFDEECLCVQLQSSFVCHSQCPLFVPRSASGYKQVTFVDSNALCAIQRQNDTLTCWFRAPGGLYLPSLYPRVFTLPLRAITAAEGVLCVTHQDQGRVFCTDFSNRSTQVGFAQSDSNALVVGSDLVCSILLNTTVRCAPTELPQQVNPPSAPNFMVNDDWAAVSIAPSRWHRFGRDGEATTARLSACVSADCEYILCGIRRGVVYCSSELSLQPAENIFSPRVRFTARKLYRVGKKDGQEMSGTFCGSLGFPPCLSLQAAIGMRRSGYVTFVLSADALASESISSVGTALGFVAQTQERRFWPTNLDFPFITVASDTFVVFDGFVFEPPPVTASLANAASLATTRTAPLFVVGPGAALHLNQCTFRRVTSTVSGSAVTVDGGDFVAVLSRFESCESPNFAGAVSGNKATIFLSGVSFLNNFVSVTGEPVSQLSAHVGGGALGLVSSTATVAFSSFEGSRVKLSSDSTSLGGSIYAFSSDVSLEYVKCINSSAARGGCGSFVGFRDDVPGASTVGLGQLRASQFDLNQNTASLGGGLYLSSMREVSLKYSVVADNVASLRGGALYMADTAPGLLDVRFDRNRAPAGGAIFSLDTAWRLLANVSFDTTGVESEYGVRFATPAYDVQVLNDTMSQRLHDAGGVLAPPLVLQVIDRHLQRVVESTPSTATAAPVLSLSGATITQSDSGYIVFDGLIVRASPNSTLQLQISVSLPDGVIVRVPTIPIRIKPCSAGYFVDSATNACSACPRGTFSNSSMQSSCFDCQPGWFANETASIQCQRCANGTVSQLKATACTLCAPGSYTNDDHLTCELCPKGTFQAQAGRTSCALCPVGKYSDFNGSVECGSCSSTGYTTTEGQSACLSCSGLTGVSCEEGIAIVEKNYWAYVRADGTVAASACLPGACAGGMASNVTCGKNRPSGSDNVLCGLCNPGFISAASGDCVPCEKSNGALVFALFVCIWIYVLILHALSQSSSAEVKVLLYFVSASRLIIGPENSAVAWFAFWELNPGRALWNDQCVMKLTSYEQMIADVLMHFIAIGQLWITAGLFFLYIRLVESGRIQSRFRSFSHRPFVRTTSALIIYSFSTLTSVLFNFLQCVDVGNRRVLFRSPEVDCDSAAYASRLWLIWLLLMVWVVGLPCSIGALLYWGYRRDRLAEHQFRSTWGLLYESYSHSRFYFEPLLLLRRVLVVALAVLLYTEPLVRAQALSFVCLLWFTVQLFSHPFSRSLVNHLESLSLGILTTISILLTSSEQFSDVGLFYRVIVILIVLSFAITLALWIVVTRCRKGVHSYQTVYRQWTVSSDRSISSLLRSFATLRRQTFHSKSESYSGAGAVDQLEPSLYDNVSSSQAGDLTRVNTVNEMQMSSFSASATADAEPASRARSLSGRRPLGTFMNGAQVVIPAAATSSLHAAAGTASETNHSDGSFSSEQGGVAKDGVDYNIQTPSAWERYEDEHGVPYWYNAELNVSSWVDPAASTQA